jgi:arginine-tRNA-protein transferase
MTKPLDFPLLRLYSTPPHRCSYLSDRTAITLFVDPAAAIAPHTYSALLRQGFRRSGEHIYRPQCATCRACIPVRIPAAQFKLTRAQRRALEHNRDLVITTGPAEPTEEHYSLYQRYVHARHPGGDMETMSVEQFRDFFLSSWAETEFIEFRLDRRLLAVAVVDRLEDGLSAIYTFFEPTETKRSLGRFAVLCEVAEVRRRGLNWLYLGYWVQGCRKMAYKNEYQPLEYFTGGEWTQEEMRVSSS